MRARTILLSLAILALPLGAQTPSPAYQPLSGSERWRLYLRSTYMSPGSWFGVAGPALGSHMGDEPEVWGQGAEGYAKRFGNRFGRMALRKSYEAAGAAALGHEVRYVPSRRKSAIARVGHALAANFVTYDRHGGRTPHISRVGSVFAAQFTAIAWMPDGYRDMNTVMRGAGVELGVSSGFNLVKEFAPEIKRLLRRK